MSVTFQKYLTTKEVAAILRVSPGTLNVWRSVKRYPLPYVKIGHAVRYKATDVQAFLAKHEEAR